MENEIFATLLAHLDELVIAVHALGIVLFVVLGVLVALLLTSRR